MGVPASLSTVPDVTPYIQYVATNGQVLFDYPFPITQDADLVVVINGVTLATDSGYGTFGTGNDKGGYITLATGSNPGDIVTMFRDIPIERISQISQNSGFSSTVFNAEFNNFYLIAQQLQASLAQSLQIPNTNNPSPVTVLSPALYAGKYLTFDANGNPQPGVLTDSGAITTSLLAPFLSLGQTPAESAVSVVPTNLQYSPTHIGDDVRRYGNIDLTGGTDCRGILNTANSVGVSLYLPPGTYKISSNLTLSSPLIFDAGAILKPDAGVTLTITQPITCGDYQAFNLSGAGSSLVMAHQDKFRARWFGVKADGSTDDTTSWLWALNTANGRVVKGPVGITCISSPLSNTTATEIRIEGVSPAYLPEGWAMASGASYNDLPSTYVNAAEYSVFQCNGCNLIGKPDSGTMNASSQLRNLKRYLVWGVNCANNIGIYVANEAAALVIEECSIVLFGLFGILSRSGEFTKFDAIYFADNGWNLAESQSTSGAGYYSGCGMRVISNFTAGDYHTINQADQPTVFKASRLWFFTRNDTDLNKSGLRGLQLSGVIDAEISKIGSYCGNYYYLSCVSQTGHHIENYCHNGFAVGDSLPRALAVYDCDGEALPGYETNFGVTTSDPWQIDSSGTASVAWQFRYKRFGLPSIIAGKNLSRLPQNNLIKVVTPGGTDIITFADICQTDANAIAPFGFYGNVFVMLQDVSNVSVYAIKTSVLGAFNGGASWVDIAETVLDNRTTASGGFSISMALDFNNGDLRLHITWGASWAANTQFYLSVGLDGVPCPSV